MEALTALTAGFILDLIFGDPHWMPHPVRLMGSAITYLEGICRKIFPQSKQGEQAAGAVLALLMVTFSFVIPGGLLLLLQKAGAGLRILAESLMCYQILALKSLKTESMKVYTAAAAKDLVKARTAVSMIVGRDTAVLDHTGVIKAAVETVAENASDGIIAPLLFMAVGGAPLGFVYKCINTMDSMIGYKNEKYLYFGKAAAKLDDLVNYIPSRISAVAMVLAAYLLRLNGPNAWRIFRRDRRNHASPNSAQTEAACAGALGIQLAGDAWYFGVLHHKKTIGDDLRPVEPEDIKRANQLLYATSVLVFCVVVVIKWLI